MSRKNNSESKKNQKRKNRSNKQNSNSKRSNQSMKYEIANEFGVDLGPETSSRCNDKVGGEMTKRLVDLARSSKKKSK